MKTSHIFIVVIIILLVIAGVAWNEKNNNATVLPPSAGPESEQVASIEGCYVARTDRDAYTLRLLNIDDKGSFTGTLMFKNFEKDSSSGTFDGTYENGVLFGEYSFMSEGVNSVMEVIFKKTDDGFVRGYGELNQDGTRFVSKDTVQYDASSVLSLFKKEACM